MRVIEEYGFKLPFRVVDEDGGIAIGKYGYKGRLLPVRYRTKEAAERAIARAALDAVHERLLQRGILRR